MDRSENQVTEKGFALVGMPGCGKSTIGECLAEKLDLPFYDLDVLFAQEYGLSPLNFITNYGEHTFRLKESEVLRRFLKTLRTRYVFATGGGTPCFHHNHKLIRKHCRVLFINTELSVLYARLNKLEHSIFNDTKEEEKLIRLTEIRHQRLPFYLESDQSITQNQLNNPYLFTKALYLFTKGAKP